tara:strand:+ start:180 stop:449 length:270 start_codon:yes stop_codon:yes gene_type:complete
MCIGGGGRSPKPMPQLPPISSRNPDLAEASRLPDKKELVDEEDVTSIEYGTSKKAGSQAKATGAKQLRIPLNTGTTSTASTGGVTGGTK